MSIFLQEKAIEIADYTLVKPQKTAKSSMVWNHFRKYDAKHNRNEKVVCLACKDVEDEDIPLFHFYYA